MGPYFLKSWVPISKLAGPFKISEQCSSSRCKCWDAQSHYLKWLPPCKGLVHCLLANNSSSAREDKIGETKAAAAAVPEPEPDQLLDLSNTEDVENAGNTKSAAQVFIEGKVVHPPPPPLSGQRQLFATFSSS